MAQEAFNSANNINIAHNVSMWFQRDFVGDFVELGDLLVDGVTLAPEFADFRSYRNGINALRKRLLTSRTASMTATLNEGLTGREFTDRVPKLGKISAEERESLLRLTAEFIQTEKTGIKEYKDLVKASKGYYKGVLVLLLQTIIHDSQKHLMILEFIDRKLKKA